MPSFFPSRFSQKMNSSMKAMYKVHGNYSRVFRYEKLQYMEVNQGFIQDFCFKGENNLTQWILWPAACTCMHFSLFTVQLHVLYDLILTRIFGGGRYSRVPPPVWIPVNDNQPLTSYTIPSSINCVGVNAQYFQFCKLHMYFMKYVHISTFLLRVFHVSSMAASFHTVHTRTLYMYI